MEAIMALFSSDRRPVVVATLTKIADECKNQLGFDRENSRKWLYMCMGFSADSADCGRPECEVCPDILSVTDEAIRAVFDKPNGPLTEDEIMRMFDALDITKGN